MKKRNAKSCLIALLLTITWISASAQITIKNPFGLKIISDTAEYQKLTNENPEKTLVDIQKLIPGITLDIRYATTNNFTNQVIYKSPKAFLRKPVAEALNKAQKELTKKGLGLKVFDAYRPYSATLKFYDVYPDTNFVASPRKGSRHNRGCAVDVTIIDLKTGKELEMPTLFDDFTIKASQSYNEIPEKAKENRKLLADLMIRYGFVKYESEWWHYDFKGWENFELMDIPFEELK
jgi:D-alanyl-D-alanine dipeptidase